MLAHPHILHPSKRKTLSLQPHSTPVPTASSAAGFCHCSPSCGMESHPVLPSPLQKKKKMQFDLLPVWMPCLHDDATPHIEGSCQGLARSSPEHAAPILDPPCWERDIPPWLGLLARLSPSKHQANIATTSFSLLSNQQWVDTHPG